ncbi:helix-turn-helix domain-containing protein [Ferrovibrio sp.]|uniref:helix-turn-helix domain-containing protein n=1 Tax=Ferrovibrio sp. TaxID=1917215 RepID=UPI00311FB393
MPRDGTATRTAIMDAAQALILETGFAAASIDTIIARTGITKGAFFYHFRTKAELARALVERDAALDAAHLERHLSRAETLSRDPLQQVLLCLGFYEEEMVAMNAPYPGCLYACFLYEAQLFDAETMDLVRGVFAHWAGQIGDKLRQAARLHPPRLPVSIATLADMGLAITEGAYILSKLRQDPLAVAAQFRHYRNYLELLFSAPGAALDGKPAPA